MEYTSDDIKRLRALAHQVREIAELPQQQENKRLWQRVNDLEMERPVLHVRDYPLYLIEYGNELKTQIEEPFLKSLELELLVRIYEWKHLRVDRVVSKEIKCQCVIQDTGWGDITMYKGVDSNGVNTDGRLEKTVHFKRVIHTLDDVELIQEPKVAYDREATERRYELMKYIFDGILEVKLFGKQYFRVAPWDDIMTWMGMGDALMDFYENPELMHASVKRYIEKSVLWVKRYEELGLLSSNNAFENVLNNDPGYTAQLPEPTESGIGCKLKDMWGANSDQILTSVSPGMTKEFAFDYEKTYAELFGLYGYGCCERLDNKMPYLKESFKNLRKVSVSPFSQLEPCLEQLGHEYVACFKPNSTYLVLDDFEEAKRLLTEEMRNVLRLAKKHNNNLVINMKTLINLHDDPTRLWWWCDMAREMVDSEW